MIGVLLMAHGGPDTLEDVEPFLRQILKDRPLAPAYLAEVQERYRLIGGKSPLLAVTRRQATATAPDDARPAHRHAPPSPEGPRPP